MVRCMTISLDGLQTPLSFLPCRSTTTMSSGRIMPLLKPVGVTSTRSSSSRTERFPSVAATKPLAWSILPKRASSRRSLRSVRDDLPANDRAAVDFINSLKLLITTPSQIRTCENRFLSGCAFLARHSPADWQRAPPRNLNRKRRTPAAQDAFPSLNDFALLHLSSLVHWPAINVEIRAKLAGCLRRSKVAMKVRKDCCA